MANHFYSGAPLGTVLVGVFAGDRLVHHEQVPVNVRYDPPEFFAPPGLTLTHVIVAMPNGPVRRDLPLIATTPDPMRLMWDEGVAIRLLDY